MIVADSSQRIRLLSEAPTSKTPLDSGFPGWLRAWWRWSGRGFAAWTSDVWSVVGWAVAFVAMVVVVPIVVVGAVCAGLVRAVNQSARRVP